MKHFTNVGLFCLMIAIGLNANAQTLSSIAVSKSKIRLRDGEATAFAVGFSKPCDPDICPYSIFWNSVTFNSVPVPLPPAPTQYSWAGSLSSVAVVAGSVWAVGSTQQFYCEHLGTCPPAPFDRLAVFPFIVRWQNAQWQILPTPLVSIGTDATDDHLFGVAGSSVNDIWAVGYAADLDAPGQPIIFHWDGSSWSVIQHPPNQGVDSTNNHLASVTSIAKDDAWSVGAYQVGTAQETLVYHWDGTLWNVVKAQDPGKASNVLTSVSGMSPTNVWAVGSASDQLGRSSTLVERWNGSTWIAPASPNVFPGASAHNDLYGVAAGPNNDAWMVGCADDGLGKRAGIIFHLQSGNWKRWIIPQACLRSIAIGAGKDVWAAGNRTSTGGHSLVMRWNGSAWKTVPTP